MRKLGIGLRRPLRRWLETRPPEIDCLEIIAEHFYHPDKAPLLALRQAYPLVVHSLGLSLGTPGPLDSARLKNLADVISAAKPMWISDHVAFTKTSDVDLGHLNPICPTKETLKIFVEHALEVRDTCKTPLLLENITSHLRLAGQMKETDFLNRLCEQGGCKLLLDITNLWINAYNHRFDAYQWLHEIDPTVIVQLHVVGYHVDGNRWEDRHADAVQTDVLELLEAVLEYAPVEMTILERDENIPPIGELIQELNALRRIVCG